MAARLKKDEQAGCTSSTAKYIRECRESIYKDYPEMIPHFHILHIMDNQKFTWGYERYLQETAVLGSGFDDFMC